MLFRLALIFFLIYLVVRMLGRILFPESGNGNGYNSQKNSREGNVTVENQGSGNQKKHVSKDVGDYVDYEEVD
jgi:hypothetical protein